MFYRCKDCGGNAVYDPKKKKMVCESCGNEETQEKIPQEKLHICNNCGAEIESKKTDLALKCPYCGTCLLYTSQIRFVLILHPVLKNNIGSAIWAF